MGRPTALQTKLKALGGKWKQEAKRAKEDGPGSSVPDGDYVGRLMEAKVEDSGGLRFTMKFAVVDPEEYDGESLRKSDGIETEQNLYYFARTLGNLGYEDPTEISPEEFEAIAEELTKEKPYVNLRAVTKDGSTIQNVYVNGLNDEWESDGADEDGAGDEEEEEEEEDEGAGAIEKGSRVSGTFRNVAFTGEVLELTENDTKARVKRDDTGSTVNMKVENLTLVADEEEEDEETVEVQEGMAVEFKIGRKTVTGIVEEVLSETECTVKRDDTGKIVNVAIDENLVLLEDEETDEEEPEEEEEEEEEEEKPKGRRGASSKPTPAASTAKAKPASTSKPAPATSGRSAGKTTPAAAPASRRTGRK